ncbi:YdbL family protein [Aliagarivorans taiwanensis]|uniref:YdbL family protein n=1 Tax=Aliagarivorans taiwanensis TaxID=561966 RepID=UPI00040EA5A1|nr:YdbL family protein [Aliagarivorans taiwanensis]
MTWNKWLIALLLSVSFSSMALDLADAKQQGWVGEQRNGMLAVLSNQSGVAALVADVNKKRESRYKKIAADNNLSVEQVGQLAGKKAIERSDRGHMVEAADGRFIAKP